MEYQKPLDDEQVVNEGKEQRDSLLNDEPFQLEAIAACVQFVRSVLTREQIDLLVRTLREDETDVGSKKSDILLRVAECTEKIAGSRNPYIVNIVANQITMHELKFKNSSGNVVSENSTVTANVDVKQSMLSELDTLRMQAQSEQAKSVLDELTSELKKNESSEGRLTRLWVTLCELLPEAVRVGTTLSKHLT